MILPHIKNGKEVLSMKNSHGKTGKILDAALQYKTGIPLHFLEEPHRCVRCGKVYYTVRTTHQRSRDGLCPECKQAACKKALETGKKVMKKIVIAMKKRKR